MTKGIVVTVDPGTRECGCCHWYLDQWESAVLAVPFKSVVARARTKTLFDRCRELIYDIEIDWPNVDSVLVEEPKIFGGGLGFAAKESAMELMFFCGWLAGWASSVGADFFMVPIAEWKGNLPKKIVCERIAKIAKKEHKSLAILSSTQSHDWDACGIGFHAQGFKL